MSLLTREQLEERLALLHRASLELVRDLSSDTLLEKIVNIAREEVNATYAALGVLDEQGKLIRFIPVGMTPSEITSVGRFPIGLGLIGALAKERQTIRIPHIDQDPRSIGFPEQHPYMDSFLGVPIMHGDQLLGQIYLANKIGNYEFTADDERVIEMLAAYAAIAINNARMYDVVLERDQALIRQNEDLSFLNDAASSLASSLDIDTVLDQTLNRVLQYLGIEAGEIYLIEDGVKELHLTLHRGEFSETFFNLERFPQGVGAIGQVAETGKSLISNKLDEIPFLNSRLLQGGFKSIVCIPLSAHSMVVGVVCLVSQKENPLPERQLNVLTSITKWAGITFENAILHRQAQRLAVLEERERIGMDLHDGIIQSIYAVGLALDFARIALDEDINQSRNKIEQAIDGLNKTIRDLRAYILDLRPRELVGTDFLHNLQRLVDEYRINTMSDAALVGPDDGLVGLPTSHATALFHICQEALANVAKHSQAKKVDIHLWTTKERVLLEIADNGAGFDLHKMSITLGHGLSNMHIRARKVGGDVEITSAPGEGTTVLAWVPRRV